VRVISATEFSNTQSPAAAGPQSLGNVQPQTPNGAVTQQSSTESFRGSALLMQVIPLQPIPNQTLQVQLEGQPCTIDIVQYSFGLFVTLYVGDALVIAGVLCENFNRIVRSLYLGFSGDFVFLDMQGRADPVYTGLGSRYVLLLSHPGDLPEQG
jgi:hypothetical protein